MSLLPVVIVYLASVTAIFCCCSQSQNACPARSDVVEIANGRVAGNRIAFNDRVIYEYLGIPFAEKPVSDLRFMNTKSLQTKWPEVREAKQFAPPCLQHRLPDSSEDCLYLNVWTPKRLEIQHNHWAGKHVMVFLHGGSFNKGSASDPESNGTALSALHDVIVVTANYRLGFAGFLFAGDDENSNMGLRDQEMALKWVHQNIHAFGGDANQITVFGHSAGAISTGVLVLSNNTNGLFGRAIMQSGSPYSSLRPDRPQVALTKAQNFSRFLDCRSDADPRDQKLDGQEMQCLRHKTSKDLMTYGPHEKTHSIILPNPMFGDSFLPQDVATILRSKLQENGLKPMDLMIGMESQEAELFLLSQVPHVSGRENRDVEITLSRSLQIIDKLFDGKLTSDERQQVIQHYLASHGDQMSSLQLKNTLIRIYGDLYVYCPSYFYAVAYLAASERQANLFMYELASKASHGASPECDDVCHGEEMPLVFGQPFLHPLLFQEEDRRLSARVMHHWTRFAKRGTPDDEWTSFEESGKYLILRKDGTQSEMSDDKFANCESFWRRIFDARK